MTIGNFSELLGTDGFDSISGADLQIIYGLEGDDVLNSFPDFGGGSLPDGGETTILVGGSGNNAYEIRNNSTAIVIENNNSPENILWTTIGDEGSPGIGLNKVTSFLTEIDNRHLYLGDSESDQYAILVDWQTAENQIETFDLVEGRVTYDDFESRFRDTDNYTGNVSWDQLEAIDLQRLGLDSASIDDSLTQITERATELESTDNQLQTIELFRFRNTNFATGTYVFVGEAEREAILNDENLSNSFTLDGVTEDGTINPAFTASLEPADNLLPFYRLSSIAVPGTFLFAGPEEYEAIFAEDSDQLDRWEKQGFNDAGEDIPEFYLHGINSEIGLEFNRFQNRENGTFLFAGPEETETINSDSNLSNAFLDQGSAFESLV